MMPQFFIENFFSEDELSVYESAIQTREPGTDHVAPYGPFANQLISNYINFIDDEKSLNLTKLKFNSLFSNFETDYKISCLMRVKLFLPWDVHNDLHLKAVAHGFSPLYNFLIPLEDVQSRTIVFDQFSSEYNDFHTYKSLHQPVEIPVDKDIWEENLSMCWPEDRLYLSLQKIMPYQRRGQLHAIARKQFHSSDNFHTRGIKHKSFIQVWVDIKDAS